ncbi:hypothetical protein KKH23_07350 [Patescibacteria group bacterium]|uniref:Uncharacterized protein n=1 Tax=viral metagenome TaxID=1070528 RepID=A0A6M3X4K8_9ZZZZ|nr:hypothetical protein [Patescibacteria group bacterium]
MSNLTVEQTYDYYISELKRTLAFLKMEKVKKAPSAVYIIFSSNGTIDEITLNEKYAFEVVEGWNGVIEDIKDKIRYEKFHLY